MGGFRRKQDKREQKKKRRCTARGRSSRRCRLPELNQFVPTSALKSWGSHASVHTSLGNLRILIGAQRSKETCELQSLIKIVLRKTWDFQSLVHNFPKVS